MSLQLKEWHIGVSPWIIQDGNYTDFHRGETVDFALEFFPHALRSVDALATEARHVDEGVYRIRARVVVSESEVVVIDFGVCAYREHLRRFPRRRFPRGSLVEGEIDLGIDPFMYFESLNESPWMPPLVYKWRVDRILKSTAPLINGTTPDGGRCLIRDESRRTVEEIEHTDAWGDERPIVSPRRSAFRYILVCTRMDAAPQRQRANR